MRWRSTKRGVALNEMWDGRSSAPFMDRCTGCRTLWPLYSPRCSAWLRLRARLLPPLLARPHMTALAATLARTRHGHVHFKHHEQQINCQAEGHLQKSSGGGAWGADKRAGMFLGVLTVVGLRWAGAGWTWAVHAAQPPPTPTLPTRTSASAAHQHQPALCPPAYQH